eukprot:gene19069-22834_t
MEVPEDMRSTPFVTPLLHVSLGTGVPDEPFRSYTPIDFDGKNLHFIIKGYPDGIVSKHIHEARVGDRLLMRGPLPTCSEFQLDSFTKPFLICMAGGTGIAPIIQVLSALIRANRRDVHVILLYSNRTQSDILFQAQLEAMAQAHPTLCTLYHILTQEPTSATVPPSTSTTFYLPGQRLSAPLFAESSYDSASIHLLE